MAKSLSTKEGMKVEQAALMSGPYAAAMIWTKEKLAQMFQSRLFDAEKTSKALDIANTAREIMTPLQEVRHECETRIPASASINCEKQVMLSISDLTAKATDPERGNPVIALIQRAMFEYLNRQNTETLRQLRSGFASEDSNDDDEGGTLRR
jgi:hypothetical protein